MYRTAPTTDNMVQNINNAEVAEYCFDATRELVVEEESKLELNAGFGSNIRILLMLQVIEDQEKYEGFTLEARVLLHEVAFYN